MQQGNAAEQIERIRRQTVTVLDELIEKAGEFELAEPPPALDEYRRKLRENSYKVLVVGEAKRGKSSFVNALVGQDVLPTDVDIATSQVFSVRPASGEAYRLRFEDGSAKEITREDLPLYGSQVMADAGAMPTSDQIIRWIEVDAPIRFLPPGVSILDTPGLGALYATHAQITYRFVPEADAVIYVLDSAQPVVHSELKFIEEISKVTRNVFFIQTKIDQFGKEDWQEVLRRNQEVLKERFEGKLVDTRVWPVSSKNLRKAAEGDAKTEAAYLMVSRHKELMGALQAFLARMSGYTRSAEAVSMAVRYHTTSRKALAGRVAGLTAESKQKHAELQKAAMENKQLFEAEWGPRGQKTRELQEGLQRATAVGKQAFVNALQPGGDIELAQKAKIEAIETLKEANRIDDAMSEEVVTAVANRWVLTCKEVQYRCVQLLGPLAEAVDRLSAPVDPNISGLELPGGDPEEDRFKRDYFTMLRGAQGGAMMVTGAGALLGTSVMTGGLIWLAIPALGLLGFKGITSSGKTQVKQAQGQLRQQLSETLQQVRRHFFDVNLMTGSFSRVDEFFKGLQESVNEQVKQTVEQRTKDAQGEIARLNEAAQLDGRARDAQTKQAQEQLARWDQIGKSAGAVAGQIRALQGARAPVQRQNTQQTAQQQGAAPVGTA